MAARPSILSSGGDAAACMQAVRNLANLSRNALNQHFPKNNETEAVEANARSEGFSAS